MAREHRQKCDSMPKSTNLSVYFPTDNKILVMGGMSDDSNPKDHFWSYDVENDKWKALPSMPTPRYASAAFEINNKLYVIGGYQCLSYDILNDKWKALPSMPILGRLRNQ